MAVHYESDCQTFTTADIRLSAQRGSQAAEVNVNLLRNYVTLG